MTVAYDHDVDCDRWTSTPRI